MWLCDLLQVGIWHPLAPGMYEDLKEYLNWWVGSQCVASTTLLADAQDNQHAVDVQGCCCCHRVFNCCCSCYELHCSDQM